MRTLGCVNGWGRGTQGMLKICGLINQELTYHDIAYIYCFLKKRNYTLTTMEVNR